MLIYGLLGISVKMGIYSSFTSPFKKKKTSKSIEWLDSDAPDAKGKFKS